MTTIQRRQFLQGAASLALSVAALDKTSFCEGRSRDDDRRMRLILLGTKGGPRVSEGDRSNPATLILIGRTPYVVDCGYGVSRQLLRAEVPLNTVRYIFITHHHADHNLEYGPLVYNGWATGVPSRVDSYGPPGLDKMTRVFFEYTRFDIETRIVDEGRPDLRKLVVPHEIKRPGVVVENDEVKISAALVHHPPVAPAFAFRFDGKDRSVVISGDTAFNPELAEFAKGADVLVHEAMYVPAIEALIKRVPNAGRLRAHLMNSHTSTEDVGRIAEKAGVKTLVLSHLVPGDDSSITDEQWAEDARKHFGGRIIVGKDLMEI